MTDEIPSYSLRGKQDDDRKIIHLKEIVPITQRIVFEFCHDVNTAAHLGVRKTIARIWQNFYRPELQANVRLYIVYW